MRSAKNPIEALSGDQNGEMPPSVPGSCQASSSARDRSQSAVASPRASAEDDEPAVRRDGEDGVRYAGVHRARPSHSVGKSDERRHRLAWSGRRALRRRLRPPSAAVLAADVTADEMAADSRLSAVPRWRTSARFSDTGGTVGELSATGGSASACRLNARRAIMLAKITPARNASATIQRPVAAPDGATVLLVEPVTVGAGSERPASRSSISRRASAMSASRRPRSFSRHRRSSVRTSGGVSPGNAVQSGSPRMTAPSVSATATPGNARFAVNISYKRQPNAQMSLLRQRGRPSPARD